ncbi:hypothetical protein HPB47_001476 [Ixodes persulcatus]|uniref:Uncharacterized protein n=1 Tax=Ixodes persulcatus TaxID=34615 RepID=A0AC60PQD1_IXOPE|nr:hypothetical protein HPB47_001476 [Ixodes persulcatus]
MEVPKMEEPTKRPQRKVKGLKMPDGTYVGIKDKNKYLSAMQKEHLKCDYAPFCILIMLAATVIILVYLQTYRPGNMHVEAHLGKTKTAITFPDVSPSIKNNHDEQRASG